MADAGSVLELLVVIAIIGGMALILYHFVIGQELGRKTAITKSSSSLGNLSKSLASKGIVVQDTFVNETLPASLKVKPKVAISIAGAFSKDATVKITDTGAELLLEGKNYPFECSFDALGSNVKMVVCAIKNVPYKGYYVQGTIYGIISDGKFSGTIRFTIIGA